MADGEAAEDRGLLTGTAATETRRRRPMTVFLSVSKWTALAFLALVTVLALPLLAYTRRQRLPSASPSDDTAKQLAFALHPERHLAREPTVLIFNWTITLGSRAPDGVEKEVYLVNGLFPGPTIEARSGDRIVVDVANGLVSEGLALHWHGLRMKGNNSMDGAIGFTQCPIPPGASFAYDFTVGHDEHGTFWWHGHGQAQRADGLYGGLIVHRPAANAEAAAAASVDNEALLLVGDWFHRKQKDVLSWYSDYGSLGNEPVPDSLLVNGLGHFNCSMAVPARPVVCNQLRLDDIDPLFARKSSAPTRVRIVNTGTVAGFSLAVDGASLQPVAVDGACAVDAQPGRSVGILYPGERVDVLLRWRVDGDPHPRVNIHLDDENLLGFPNEALAPNQSFMALPRDDDMPDANMALPPQLGPDHVNLYDLKAASTRFPPVEAQQTILLYIKTQKLSRFENRPLGFVNHTTWKAQTPPLLSLNRGSWDSHQMLPFIRAASSTQPKTVDIVINNLDDGSHPIHLHGNSFHLLYSYREEGRGGWGSYNPFESEPPSAMNLENPVVKDTVMVPRRGHVIVRLTADNPGLWMMHCHMLVHMGTGMVAGLHVGDRLDHADGIDSSAARLCKNRDGVLRQ